MCIHSKEFSSYHTIALISHDSKVMLKILQDSYNSMWAKNFQMFKMVLEKAEGPEIIIANVLKDIEKQ